MAVSHRLYARALFDAAQEQGRFAAIREELADVVAMTREVPELRALLVNPQIDRRVKAAALADVLADSDELVRNFLLVLVEKNRAGELAEIAREFDALVARAERRLEVELTTAYELTDEDAEQIIGQIQAAAGRTVDATRRVDPDLIGGFVLQAGSMRVDASVRGRLDALRHQLVRR